MNGSRSSTATGGVQAKIGQEEKKVAEKSFVSSGTYPERSIIEVKKGVVGCCTTRWCFFSWD